MLSNKTGLILIPHRSKHPYVQNINSESFSGKEEMELDKATNVPSNNCGMKHGK
ncbi:MAG: hypothetical protein IPG00_02810 [Saprospiraceae bacterium]|nr:hypothetical protein [Saprospiraceae bacterium]